jgi:hypothetical protein
MRASRAFDSATTTNHVARAASPPTLAKNARMGHPQSERCIQKPLQVGHPPVLGGLVEGTFGAMGGVIGGSYASLACYALGEY